MIIETPYKVGDTVSFKLTSGEEIVARLEEEGNGFYAVKKPMALVAGQNGIGLAPFMFSVSEDAKLRLQANSVSCLAKTEQNLAVQYTSQTTGIAIN